MITVIKQNKKIDHLASSIFFFSLGVGGDQYAEARAGMGYFFKISFCSVSVS